MPRGDKHSYTSKQKRQAADIEAGYERKGVSKAESERRAWATVNKISGGGLKKSGAQKSATKKSIATKSTPRKAATKKHAAAKAARKSTPRKSG